MLVQPVTWLNSAQTLRLPLAPMFSLAWLLSIVSLSIVALDDSVVLPAWRSVTS
jgi:hypothetical protein